MDSKDAPPSYEEIQSQGFGNPVGQSGFSNPVGQPGFNNPVGQPGFSNPGGQPGFNNPVGQPGFSNPGGQPGFSNPAGQPVYSYPAQTNYGYSAQPVIQQQQQLNNVVVTSGGWNQGSYVSDPEPLITAAWIACLCCFWPTGLIAITRANESRDALARGDMAGAHIAANSARLMIRISFAVLVVIVICVTAFVAWLT